MSNSTSTIQLDPTNVAESTALPFDVALGIPREQYEGPQLEALIGRGES